VSTSSPAQAKERAPTAERLRPGAVRQRSLTHLRPGCGSAARPVRPALALRLRPGHRRHLRAARSGRLPGGAGRAHLIKELPLPVRVLIGDFTNEPRQLATLGPPATTKVVTGVDDHSRSAMMAAVVGRATVGRCVWRLRRHWPGSGARGGPDRQRQALRRPVRQGRGGDVRQDLPQQRDHSSAPSAGVAEPERERPASVAAVMRRTSCASPSQSRRRLVWRKYW
jgi:hypothetical protein